MFPARTLTKIRRIVSDSSLFVGVGVWVYYSMSNIGSLFLAACFISSSFRVSTRSSEVSR